MPDQNFADLFVQKIVNEYKAFGDALGQQLGGTSDTQRYSDADQLKMWNSSPIADPAQRAQAMYDLYQQGVQPEAIIDQIYPERRKLITAGRPDLAAQIKYAEQMDRLMARQARDQGVHFPHDETWAQITAPNAPAPETSPGMPGVSPDSPVAPAQASSGLQAGAPPSPIDVQPTQATSTPGWADAGKALF